jgi:hypothetical protein
MLRLGLSLFVVLFTPIASARLTPLPYLFGVKNEVARVLPDDRTEVLKRPLFLERETRIETHGKASAAIYIHQFGVIVLAPQTKLFISSDKTCRMFLSLGAARFILQRKEVEPCSIETPSLPPQPLQLGGLDVGVVYSHVDQRTTLDFYRGRMSIAALVGTKSEIVAPSENAAGMVTTSKLGRPQSTRSWQLGAKLWMEWIDGVPLHLPHHPALTELQQHQNTLAGGEATKHFERESLGHSAIAMDDELIRHVRSLSVSAPP